MPPLTFYDSLSRSLQPFRPLDPANVRVYSCGPTVYNYAHLGNLRAYVFTDTLARVLRWRKYPLTHVINITDVGHLQSDADAGDDKMEARARETGQDIWAIAQYYTDRFKQNLRDLNVIEPTHFPRATDYIDEMKGFAAEIEARGFAYRLTEEEAPGAAGLYFNVAKLGGEYGKLARADTEAARSPITEGRIDLVETKEQVADFALWRTTPPGDRRQMEWQSDWGRGAPGWHLECSVMSQDLLGFPFDIHTGGIDHREIHHPNEIAQNQAYCGCGDTGASLWMHNNFLVDRTGKMAKSSGDFLTLRSVVDRGFHPLAYRLMCLQAHYRSEMEFSWEGLAAASTRLKRWVSLSEGIRTRCRAAYTESFSSEERQRTFDAAIESGSSLLRVVYRNLDAAMADDLGTPGFLSLFDASMRSQNLSDAEKLELIDQTEGLLGLRLAVLSRSDLRLRPLSASITEDTIQARLAERRDARAAKDFARSDAIRAELLEAGVEVMDGDPLGWDWRT